MWLYRDEDLQYTPATSLSAHHSNRSLKLLLSDLRNCIPYSIHGLFPSEVAELTVLHLQITPFIRAINNELEDYRNS